jgi:hypothetical protein
MYATAAAALSVAKDNGRNRFEVRSAGIAVAGGGFGM